MIAQTHVWTVDQVAAAPDEAELIARCVRPHRHEYGRANAVVHPNGSSVSAVIRTLISNNGNVAEAARAWEVTEDAVRGTIAFCRRFRSLFDARMLLEDDDSDIDFRMEYGERPCLISFSTRT